MKTFLASALLVLAASAAKKEVEMTEDGVTVTLVDDKDLSDGTAETSVIEASVEDGSLVIEKTDITVEVPEIHGGDDVLPPTIEDPVIEHPELLMDYVDQEGTAIADPMVVDEVTHEETSHMLLDQDFSEAVYHDGDLVSVHGDECERAIGHDGHYDEETGIWMLEEDFDYEPEWRCLMRPLLHTATGAVQAAELSVESRSILQEKKALVAVHERLVEEAKAEHDKASCLELIERHMAEYQECELGVLRTYVQVADAYPATWVQFLEQKKDCVNKFAEAVATCSHQFIYDPEQFSEHLEIHGVSQEAIDYINPYGAAI